MPLIFCKSRHTSSFSLQLLLICVILRPGTLQVNGNGNKMYKFILLCLIAPLSFSILIANKPPKLFFNTYNSLEAANAHYNLSEGLPISAQALSDPQTWANDVTQYLKVELSARLAEDESFYFVRTDSDTLLDVNELLKENVQNKSAQTYYVLISPTRELAALVAKATHKILSLHKPIPFDALSAVTLLEHIRQGQGGQALLETCCSDEPGAISKERLPGILSHIAASLPGIKAPCLHKDDPADLQEILALIEQAEKNKPGDSPPFADGKSYRVLATAAPPLVITLVTGGVAYTLYQKHAKNNSANQENDDDDEKDDQPIVLRKYNTNSVSLAR